MRRTRTLNTNETWSVHGSEVAGVTLSVGKLLAADIANGIQGALVEAIEWSPQTNQRCHSPFEAGIICDYWWSKRGSEFLWGQRMKLARPKLGVGDGEREVERLGQERKEIRLFKEDTV